MKDSDFSKLETTFKIKLPETFKSHISKLAVEDPSGAKDASIDLSLDSLGILRSLHQFMKANKYVRSGGKWFSDKESDWPNHFFVIGDNGSGDFWYIDLRKPQQTVFFYDHETGSSKKYASSLPGFVTTLRKTVKAQTKNIESRQAFQKHYAAAKKAFQKTPIGQYSVAVDKNDFLAVRKLLKAGLNPKSRIPLGPLPDDEIGPTLLGEAVSRKRSAIVEELLSAGLKFGNSDFHYAVDVGYLESVKVFIKFGADVKAKFKGKTAYQLAVSNNKQQLASFLKKLEAR